MLSLVTASFVAIPATQLAGQLASHVATGVAEAGRSFFNSLAESTANEGTNETQALFPAAKKDPKVDQATKPTSIADLLKAIQSLIDNLSDNPDDSVTIQSVSDNEVSVTGNEPLASSVKQWTKLHPEWVKDWQSYAAKAGPTATDLSSPLDAPSGRLSAKISATSAKVSN